MWGWGWGQVGVRAGVRAGVKVRAVLGLKELRPKLEEVTALGVGMVRAI